MNTLAYLGIDLLAIAALTTFYFRRHRRRDLVVSYLCVNIGVLAVTQVLIYVGAISTLIIFAIMLSRGVMDPGAQRFNGQWGLVAGFGAVFFVLLTAVLTRVPWPAQPGAVAPDAIQTKAYEPTSQLQNFVESATRKTSPFARASAADLPHRPKRMKPT